MRPHMINQETQTAQELQLLKGKPARLIKHGDGRIKPNLRIDVHSSPCLDNNSS